MTLEKITDLAVVNGTVLYYEKKGNGPALLFIAGSTGDAGNFTRAADLLADEFTVVTYDRRAIPEVHALPAGGRLRWPNKPTMPQH